MDSPPELTPARDLDDATALAEADPGGMLRAVAGSAAQVRAGLALARESDISRFAEGGRPRSLLIAGMGGSGIVGDFVRALTGEFCPVPVIVRRGVGLPAWVGALDAVVAISRSGRTWETLAVIEDAVRRGCRLLVVAAASSPAAERARQARAPLLGVPEGLLPRARLWSMAIPVLWSVRALGLLDLPAADVEETALRLETIARSCAPDVDSLVNPGKELAGRLFGRLPVFWGAAALPGAAAARLARQCNENAEVPAIFGELPELGHNQIVALDVGAGAGTIPQQVVLLRDPEGEGPLLANRADVVAELAAARGTPCYEVSSAGVVALERLASLVGIGDFASVYLAMLRGVDPSRMLAIEELKSRTA